MEGINRVNHFVAEWNSQVSLSQVESGWVMIMPWASVPRRSRNFLKSIIRYHMISLEVLKIPEALISSCTSTYFRIPPPQLHHSYDNTSNVPGFLSQEFQHEQCKSLYMFDRFGSKLMNPKNWMIPLNGPNNPRHSIDVLLGYSFRIWCLSMPSNAYITHIYRLTVLWDLVSLMPCCLQTFLPDTWPKPWNDHWQRSQN